MPSAEEVTVVEGDCLSQMQTLEDGTVDLAYLDPPFFTNRHHAGINKARGQKFVFADVWSGLEDYVAFMAPRLSEVHRALKPSGSIFLHCDTNANFVLRALLDKTFGVDEFRSEIIWSYKRWSNSAKGLLPAHQTIFHYSKSPNFKFNRIFQAYSETTNVDQILQLRSRDEHGKSAYATDADGEVLYGTDKKGVPLSDVWEIPFLNPKARERVGYPTQKPILLLERIIQIASDPNDLILDPFCGSGTTLVAAKLLGRRALGIDTSSEAVLLSVKRLKSPVKTESALMAKGRLAYSNANFAALAILDGLDLVPVQRNAGIDAFLRLPQKNGLIPVKVQKADETIGQAAQKLVVSATSKKATRAVLVRTRADHDDFDNECLPNFVELVDSTAYQIAERLSSVAARAATDGATMDSQLADIPHGINQLDS